jgi:UDP-N-acetylglucosamine 2-epimerase (non-hydrolysing)
MHAGFVLTDSGGLQDETTWLDVPCFTLRANTERPITLESGTNTLVGDALGDLRSMVQDALAGRRKRAKAIEGWDGHAAERIAAELSRRWR